MRSVIAGLFPAEVVGFEAGAVRDVQLNVSVAFVPGLLVDLVNPVPDKASGPPPVCPGPTDAGQPEAGALPRGGEGGFNAVPPSRAPGELSSFSRSLPPSVS